jgi:FlaA1/EpsC-like NDP-sugar epimerase
MSVSNSSSHFDIAGKIVLITGATGGLGQAVAVGLARAGAMEASMSSSPQLALTMCIQLSSTRLRIGRRSWMSMSKAPGWSARRQAVS